MDDIVKQAIAKWPNVPFCHGWLGLDSRGRWFLRDANAQAAGAFSSGTPDAKGSRIEHVNLIEFIGRNYERDADGQWFFQNGPQRVYVELEAAPWVWRIEADLSLVSQTGARANARACVVDEQGKLYLDSEIGFGLVHSLDVVQVAEAIERGDWTPEEVGYDQLPTRFGFVQSPAAREVGKLSK
ncbi:MAG: DUF2946 family protein [Burkholderiales bacterium]